jgi:hypothetical protein
VLPEMEEWRYFIFDDIINFMDNEEELSWEIHNNLKHNIENYSFNNSNLLDFLDLQESSLMQYNEYRLLMNEIKYVGRKNHRIIISHAGLKEI